MSVTPAQDRALRFIASEPWIAAWWAGRPHAGWPAEMGATTFHALQNKKLVRVVALKRYDRRVEITAAGRAALEN